ncbi:MAG: tetratricopeptide repeat protein [Xanthobacteraceae bacterium]|nr:tetratricopeptide repeat protein [Xanthobacteraceae bacterium]
MTGKARNLSSIAAMVLSILAATAIALPNGAFAAGSDTPSPPPPKDGSSKPPPKDKKSSIEDEKFLAGYRTAYTTIYDRHDYAAAIDQLKALGRDNVADVANLIGYSYRKLKDYDQSKIWYERALASDPNHVRTWQYYGLWQVEQGHRDIAEQNLSKIAQLAGTQSPEYRSLAAAIATNNVGY